MAKKRKTRKQKQRSSVRKASETKTKVVKNKVKAEEDILIVDEKFIKKDIFKTILISIVFTLILLGIWMWLR